MAIFTIFFLSLLVMGTFGNHFIFEFFIVKFAFWKILACEKKAGS
jgi:hypothetical protein